LLLLFSWHWMAAANRHARSTLVSILPSHSEAALSKNQPKAPNGVGAKPQLKSIFYILSHKNASGGKILRRPPTSAFVMVRTGTRRRTGALSTLQANLWKSTEGVPCGLSASIRHAYQRSTDRDLWLNCWIWLNGCQMTDVRPWFWDPAGVDPAQFNPCWMAFHALTCSHRTPHRNAMHSVWTLWAYT